MRDKSKLVQAYAQYQKQKGFPYDLLYNLNFDGIDDKIVIVNEAPFDFEINTPFSVAVLFKTSVSGSFANLINKVTTTPNYGWQIHKFSTDALVFRFFSNSVVIASVATTDTIYANNLFYFLVCTYAGNSNRSGLKIYVNGVLKAQGVELALVDSILNNRQVEIGHANSANRWNGKIVLPMIFNAELTATEVKKLWENLEIPKSKLISLWNGFEKPNLSLPTTLRDEFGTNDGVVTGATWENLRANIP